MTSSALYEPWGETRYQTGASPTDYGYTGQMVEGDLYYYGARWYDPLLGRFIQADTIVPSAQGTQAFDRYAYVNNNPLRYTDPSGRWICGDWYDPACAENFGELNTFGQMYSTTTSSPFQYVVSGSYDFGLQKVDVVDRYSDDLISPSLTAIKGPALIPVLIDLGVRFWEEFKPQPKYVPKDDLFWSIYVVNSKDAVTIDRIEFYAPEEIIRLWQISFASNDLYNFSRIELYETINNSLRVQIDYEVPASINPFTVSFGVTCVGCMTGFAYHDTWTPNPPPSQIIWHMPY